MPCRSMAQCVDELEKEGHLLRIEDQIDPRLEAAEIQRRVFAAGGPAIFFANVRGCAFPMVSNIFGTMERVRFLFRNTLDQVRRVIAAGANPMETLRRPWANADLVMPLWNARPKEVKSGAVLANETTVDHLPQLVCWPDDGGPFITLPIVYTEDPDNPGTGRANLGMYRVQLAGGQYEVNAEIGMHYQIRRGIAVHHAAALRRDEPLRVSVFVGGAPAMSVAAVFPAPEGMAELPLAGMLAGHRIPVIRQRGGAVVYADADFCITGTLDPGTIKPEGPFGDHLGYYSLAHDFPVLKVEKVYHRDGAIWPFTVVGRPPQEDTLFGQLIHELTGPAISTVLPGVHQVHAVDEAGVHPLLLAVGDERYAPYEKTQGPRELLTLADAILGQGQLSLAKYLWIASRTDDPELDANNVARFLKHVLSRVDWRRDLHFRTATTIDTLDYTGEGLNRGSKLVIAAAGPLRRELPEVVPPGLSLPDGFTDPQVCLPGVLAIGGPAFEATGDQCEASLSRLITSHSPEDPICRFPLVVLVDDPQFTSRSLADFLWTVFTRSAPARDVRGIGEFVDNKHWGCEGSLVIDARTKPHHAPPLVEDPEVTKKIDALAARGGELGRWL